MAVWNERALRVAACMGSALAIAACKLELPDGELSCSRRAACPPTWECRATAHAGSRCFKPSTEPADANHVVTQAPDAASTDAADPDSALQDVAPNAEPSDAGPFDPDPPPPQEHDLRDAQAPPASDGGHRPTMLPSDIKQAELDGMTLEGPPTTACEAVPADAARGIFVSPAPLGVDGETCGTSDKPCATIAAASLRAKNDARAFVYLDDGVYAESVAVLPGLTLIGGWDNLAGVWTRQCKATRAESAVIESTSNIGAIAEYAGTASLDTLTIQTRAQANAGESMYGLFVRGAMTELHLNDVKVIATDAGNGTDGAAGTAGTAAAGSCSAGDGASGASTSAIAAGASEGQFGPNGYAASSGQVGAAGMRGNDGTAADARCVDCRDRVLRENPELGDCRGVTVACLASVSPDQSCGDVSSTAGCGGEPGAGGLAGGGGGSSIGVYVWDSTLVLHGATLWSGNGGFGASGGAGGKGGAGSPGAQGHSGPACQSTLALVLGVVTGLPGPTAAGGGTSVGGPGGTGGDGGPGGAGAGGFSYALFHGGSANVQGVASASMRHAAAALSVSNGASGKAADVGP